ncbi:hypothetical protein SAMN05660649_02901 [Desulfotomaculum arcticum]|uniref:Uncharacterized protein n=1 Tax=Desulfotruncus arcticus DSM 17038 TaxID=1121424 RepID=A0A1I2V7Q0_9FIRM|nr:hypothetical protein [Desulfotruncus arcticus]SFG84247.1 hypothetical protein SAMN05660649_02901 [Desulfotomaculum arcticum] [Desulfotruncus arcticus DSM 17038]
MPKQNLSDFEQGYYYAQRRHTALLLKKSPESILELAMVFFLFTGDTAELARGMGTYYQELGMERMETFKACYQSKQHY